MATDYDVTATLDVKGESCPMPVVKTRQHIDDLGGGDVLEVLATDSGSLTDIAGWAGSAEDVELVDQVESGDLYTHYLRKTAA